MHADDSYYDSQDYQDQKIYELTVRFSGKECVSHELCRSDLETFCIDWQEILDLRGKDPNLKPNSIFLEASGQRIPLDHAGAWVDLLYKDMKEYWRPSN